MSGPRTALAFWGLSLLSWEAGLPETGLSGLEGRGEVQTIVPYQNWFVGKNRSYRTGLIFKPSHSFIVATSGSERPEKRKQDERQNMNIYEGGKGQGNGGGWPSTTGRPSGGGRSNG
jgi:hypothetical protein